MMMIIIIVPEYAYNIGQFPVTDRVSRLSASWSLLHSRTSRSSVHHLHFLAVQSQIVFSEHKSLLHSSTHQPPQCLQVQFLQNLRAWLVQ
jgi:hypothetical protein